MDRIAGTTVRVGPSPDDQADTSTLAPSIDVREVHDPHDPAAYVLLGNLVHDPVSGELDGLVPVRHRDRQRWGGWVRPADQSLSLGTIAQAQSRSAPKMHQHGDKPVLSKDEQALLLSTGDNSDRRRRRAGPAG